MSKSLTIKYLLSSVLLLTLLVFPQVTKSASSSNSVNVGLQIIALTPTLSFSGNTYTAPYNGSVTLSWTSGNTVSCVASGDWSGTKATSSSEVVSGITSNKTYELSCTGSGGTVMSSVVVSMNLDAPTLNVMVTSEKKANFTGTTAYPNSLITIEYEKDGGGYYTATTSADGSGNYSFTSGVLDNGSYRARVYVSLNGVDGTKTSDVHFVVSTSVMTYGGGPIWNFPTLIPDVLGEAMTRFPTTTATFPVVKRPTTPPKVIAKGPQPSRIITKANTSTTTKTVIKKPVVATSTTVKKENLIDKYLKPRPRLNLWWLILFSPLFVF